MEICFNGLSWLARQMDKRGLGYKQQENDPKGSLEWRYLRKGVADAERRAEICQAVNDRYLEALACLDSGIPVKELVGSVCKAKRWKNRQVRALHPWSDPQNSWHALLPSDPQRPPNQHGHPTLSKCDPTAAYENTRMKIFARKQDSDK